MLLAYLTTLALLIPVSIVITDPDPSGDAIAEEKELRGLESVMLRLAKGGRTEEVSELLDVMLTLGYDSESAQSLMGKCSKELGRASRRKEKMPSEARALRDVATRMATRLDTLDDDARETLARQILLLDNDVEAAHLALGNARIDGVWRSDRDVVRFQRRQRISEALAQARRLEIDVTSGPSTSKLALESTDNHASFARANGVTIHAAMTPEKTARCLRETLRAIAFCRFLMDDKLSMPHIARASFYVFSTRDQYRAALDQLYASNVLGKTDFENARQIDGWRIPNGVEVGFCVTEAAAETMILSNLFHSASWTGPGGYRAVNAQPVLRAGILNWTCLEFFGTEMPNTAWYEGDDFVTARGGRTMEAPKNEQERKLRRDLMRLARGGIAGVRSWMAYLAERHLDPSWTETMKDDMGKISGEELLKATLMFAFLSEESPIRSLFMKSDTALDNATNQPCAQRIEAALGRNLNDVDFEWRAWLLGNEGGLAQKIDGRSAKDAPISKDENEARDYLNAVRKGALGSDHASVDVDRELSDGCAAHADYLAKNPAQLAAWPDAHEEYGDHEGFTSAGAHAGLRSVIDPGADTPRDAIDGWINTFYHRLPLLQPDLLRIGWGSNGKIAVLDSGSMVATPDDYWTVVYPYDGMSKVPTDFTPELPNPVPGVDQTSLGYCVTVQRAAGSTPIDVDATLTLRVGSAAGDLVDGYISSPAVPSNPRLVLAETWCLLPKAPLRPKTQYCATFRVIDGSFEKSWSFTTR